MHNETRNCGNGGNSVQALRDVAGSLLLVAGLILAGVAVVAAQSGFAGESRNKAAFVLNLAKFVEWPDRSFADRQSPLVIGILGDDPVGASIRWQAGDEKVQGRPVVVRLLKLGEDIRGCQILFIGRSQSTHVQKILDGLGGASLLTVSDVPGFLDAGGIIEFNLEDARLQFTVYLDAAERRGIKIRAQLLGVARFVQSGQVAGNQQR